MKKSKLNLILWLMFIPMGLFAQAFESCDQWASWNVNGYTIYNNIWGSGAGSQCIWANSQSDWGVHADHPNSGGIKSYPNADYDVNYTVSSMPNITASFNTSSPSWGSYNTAFDIWYNNYAYEIMLWVNWRGEMGPISYNYGCSGYPSTACPVATNVNVGGHTWNLYEGTNGSATVYSFLRTSNTNSGTVNITQISQWLASNSYFSSSTNLHEIQFGWEISQCAGGADFTMNSYGVSISSSSSGGSSSGGSSSGGSSSGGNLTVRARGIDGSEQIQLKVNNNTVGTWTLGTSYQNYSASGYGSVTVHFTNDGGSRDAQIDYVIIDGNTYQSENQATNTGVWDNGCGGSNSEWLHCNGYIAYGGSSSSSGGSSSGGSSSGGSSSGGSSSGGSSSGGSSSGGPSNGGTYRITARHSGKVIDVQNCGTGNGTNIQQWAWLNNNCQKWRTTDLGSSMWRLSPMNATGQAMDVEGWSTSNGGNIFLWAYAGGANQRWQISSYDGYYRIISDHSGKCLDVDGVSTSNGANIHQWTCGSSQNQQFSFTSAKSEEIELTSSSVNIYPNPAYNILNVDIGSEFVANSAVEIYNNLGKLVNSIDINAQLTSIDISDLAQGIYIVKISNGLEMTTKKFTKK